MGRPYKKVPKWKPKKVKPREIIFYVGSKEQADRIYNLLIQAHKELRNGQ